MNQLTELLDDTEDTLKVERVRNALHDVAMRVQDLRTMEEVHIQFFVSIEMTRQNNNRLGQSVERTLALGSNVVMVGLAIQSALTRQKRVMEATQRTREFLGKPDRGQRRLHQAAYSGDRWTSTTTRSSPLT